MKNLLNLMLVSAFAVSCINLNGQLTIEQTMNVKKKGGFLNLSTKTITLAPGAYRADLKINSEKSFTLKLRLDKDKTNEDQRDILIPIKSEKAFNLPTNGNVKISGSEISQPFDVAGVISTKFSESSITRTTEDCSISRTENHCEKLCNTSVGADRRPITTCNIACHDVVVTFPGFRHVEYHYLYTHRDLDVAFTELSSANRLATFKASGIESDRINDYYGECR